MLKRELETLSSFPFRGQEVRAAILVLGESSSRILSLVFSKEDRTGRIAEENLQVIPVSKSQL